MLLFYYNSSKFLLKIIIIKTGYDFAESKG